LVTLNPKVLDGGAAAEPARQSPADILILADTSGGTAARDRLRQTVRAVVGSLRDEDRFALGCVDVDYRPLTRGWVQPRSPAAERALADFQQEFFLGATDLVTSLSSAI
jgi:hypothetical protein